MQREILLDENGGGLEDLVVVEDEARDVIQYMLNDLKRLVVTNQVSTIVQYKSHHIYKSTLVSHLNGDLSYTKIDCCVFF